MIMKKTLGIISIAMAIAAAAAALIVHNIKSSEKASPEEASLEEITLLLDWFPNTNHTGFYVAREKEYYRAEGLAVVIVQPSEGSADQLVATGQADFGVSSQEAVIQARAAGIPIVSIAAVVQHNTSAFASLPEARIETVKDFESKRYGGWGSPIEEAVLTAVMQEAGAEYHKVKNVTIGTSDFFATIGREADFEWIFYAWDGVEAERRGIDLNVIMLKELEPVLDYYTPVIITSEQKAIGQYDLIRKFMKATAQGYRYAIENPNDAAEILIRAVPEINADLVRASQVWLSPWYQAEAPDWGVQRREVWERYAVWLGEHGLLQSDIDIDTAYTNTFIASHF